MTSSNKSEPLNSNVTLCLACSSSLLPRLLKPKSTSPNPLAPIHSGLQFSPDVFLTRCCGRPICPDCLSNTPRLARYDPCLACLGGVSAVAARNSRRIQLKTVNNGIETMNVDGALRDQDVFAIGEDDLSENDDIGDGPENCSMETNDRATPPPVYSSYPELSAAESLSRTITNNSTPPTHQEYVHAPDSKGSSAPSKYYIKPSDTLMGIALRHGVDGRNLCRLNNLSTSTLNTTPHLLHTRTFLTLPPADKLRTPIPSPLSSQLFDAEDEAQRAKARAIERAQKRFQFVTKEVDWRVARAYIALEDNDESTDNGDMKEWVKGEKRSTLEGSNATAVGVENRAVDRYLDDDEWEREEGKNMKIEPIPRLDGKDGKGEGSRIGQGMRGRKSRI